MSLDNTIRRRPRAVRRALSVLAVSAAPVIGACGSSDDDIDADGGEDATTTATSTAADGESATTTASADGATRIVTTDGGDVELPAEIERIVTVHNIATQPLVDLGVEPVGIGDVVAEELYPDYWSKIQGIPTVGNGLEVNIEMVDQLDPDVIFAINLTPDDALARLEEIAPVVVIGIQGPQRSDWEGRAELVAEVVGREDELAALADDFDRRIEDIASEHADTLAEHTFNVLDSWEDGAVVPYGPTSMVGNILKPAGATFAPSATSELVTRIDESPEEKVSFERLPELTDGSVILHGARGSDTEPSPTQQAILDSPLLAQSEAAQAGRLYPIGKTTIAGYGDAFATLDLFDQALTDLAP